MDTSRNTSCYERATLLKKLYALLLAVNILFFFHTISTLQVYAQPEPELVVPVSVNIGDKFHVYIKNAPKGRVDWKWDSGRIKLYETEIDRAKFEAVEEGEAWIEVSIDNWNQHVTFPVNIKKRDEIVEPPEPEYPK